MSRIDPLMHNALLNLRARNGFVKSLPRGGKRGIRLGTGYFSWSFLANIITLSRRGDGSIISKLMAENEQSVRELRQRLADLTGEALLTQIEAEQKRIRQVMYGARSMAAVYAGLLASSWVGKHIKKWLGEKGAPNELSLSVEHNVTSTMGLDLLDVADVVRQYPDIVEYLRHPNARTFFDDLATLEGGEAVIRSR